MHKVDFGPPLFKLHVMVRSDRRLASEAVNKLKHTPRHLEPHRSISPSAAVYIRIKRTISISWNIQHYTKCRRQTIKTSFQRRLLASSSARRRRSTRFRIWVSTILCLPVFVCFRMSFFLSSPTAFEDSTYVGLVLGASLVFLTNAVLVWMAAARDFYQLLTS